MYGAQTNNHTPATEDTFENDVEMYGAQTAWKSTVPKYQFENDVEMYGAQTFHAYDLLS